MKASEEHARHTYFMNVALQTAREALSSNETPVACILVHHPSDSVGAEQSRVLARGMNATNASYNGTRHAEFMAIKSFLGPLSSSSTNTASSSQTFPQGQTLGMAGISRQARLHVLKETTLYVTVEPCIMCASLLRQLGIKEVYFGASNDKFGGCGGVSNINVQNGRKDKGVERGAGDGDADTDDPVLTAPSINACDQSRIREVLKGDYKVSGGWLREESIMLLREFYVQENERAPLPRTKKDRILKTEIEPWIGDVEDAVS